MRFDREAYEEFLLSNGCIGFFDPPIVLKSGRLSYWYANLRDVLKNIRLKKQLAKFVYDFATDHNLRPDFFLGIPEGATPLGEAVNELIDYKDYSEIPATILRSKPKEHGDPQDKYSVGPLLSGSHVVLVEDVTTTGGSSMEHILRLQSHGVFIDKLISCVYRLEKRDSGRTVEDVLRRDYHVDFIYLTDASTILPKACRRFKPREEVVKGIESYFQRYGVIQIKLP
jgi:orotate phosphoribosyltransferase